MPTVDLATNLAEILLPLAGCLPDPFIGQSVYVWCGVACSLVACVIPAQVIYNEDYHVGLANSCIDQQQLQDQTKQHD